MFDELNIPRKLGLSFLLICVSTAVVMSVFFTNITAVRGSTARNNLSQSIHAKGLTLETALLRQNSQMRGFLVTGDAPYLKSYDEAQAEYDKTSAELEGLLVEPKLRNALAASRKETLAWRRNWGDRLIEKVKAGRWDDAQDQVRDAGKAVLVSVAVLLLRDIREAQEASIAADSARQEHAIDTATTVLMVGAIALIGIAIALAVMLSRMIARPVTRLTRTMADLTAGRNDVVVPDTIRRDELGEMARAVLVFRDAAVAKQRADEAHAAAQATQKMVVQTVSGELSRLAEGDLTGGIARDFPGEYAAVKTNFNAAVAALRDLIASVMDASASIDTGSGEIARAAEDLARRTEANAASLEQTSAAVTQMNGRLKATADAASQTVARADGTMATVGGGRTTTDAAVQAMIRVAESAKGIDSVIEGLDKIAFQTRVLAMNAAVEAGRAGEAGRGFAVVADLVSAFAMRAEEEEAGRARGQLTATQTDILAAVEMVQKVNGSLADISGDVASVHQLLGGMSSDNHVQATAIAEISTAVGTMDRSTQQNAAMVEQTSAAARNLATEVSMLTQRARRFNLGDRAQGARKSIAVGDIARRTLVHAGVDWQSFRPCAAPSASSVQQRQG